MAATKDSSNAVTHECTYKCNPRSHGSNLSAAVTKDSVSDEKVAAYLKWCCLRYPKAVDNEGRSVIHLAASKGRLKLLTYLLKHRDVDINEKDSESHYTPLHRSLFYGQIHCAVRLIEHGANTQQLDLDYLTPLDHAMKDCRKSRPRYDKEHCEVYVWGINTNYTLGIGHNHSRTNPEPLEMFRRQGISIKQVAMSKFHALFLSADGRVYTCGHGQGGRLGLDDELTTLTPKNVKVGVKDGNNLECTMAALGIDHTILLMENKSVWSFGLNTYHQLGHSPPPDKLLAPKIIKTFKVPYIVGICASKYHSVFWSKKNLFTCGLNAGQLGHIKGSKATVQVPKVVTSINLKETNILQVACSDGATVLATEKGDVYLLHDYQCKKILSRTKFVIPKKICVVGGHLDHKINTDCLQEKGGDELKILILSLGFINTIYLWQESVGESLRCEVSLGRQIAINDIALNKNFLLLTTVDGEAFQGEIKLKKRKLLPDKDQVSHRRVTNGGLAKEEYGYIKLTRLSNIHRGVSITSDLKGRNFAVTQVHPKSGLFQFPGVVSSAMKEHMTAMLETVGDVDSTHDVVFEVEGIKFPCHRFVVGHASQVLEDMISKGDSLDDVQYVKIHHVKAQIFRRLLYFMYTRDCDIFPVGVCPIRVNSAAKGWEVVSDVAPEWDDVIRLISAFEYNLHKKNSGKKKAAKSNERDNPLRLLKSAAERFEMADFAEKLDSLRYENGYIFELKERPLVLDNIKFDREKLQHLWDVSLKSEEGTIVHAHKCILASRSEYFNSMINGGWLESTQKTAIYLPIPGKVLKVLINYLYTDEASDVRNTEDADLASMTLVIADQFFCARLKEVAEFSLSKLMNLKNAVEMLQLAVTYNADQLKLCAMEFICFNLAAFLEARSLEMLEDSVLIELTEYYRFSSPCMCDRQIPTYHNAPDDDLLCLIGKNEPVSLETVEDYSPPKLGVKTPKKKSREKRNSESGRKRNASTRSTTGSEDDPELILMNVDRQEIDDEEAWVKVVSHSAKHQKNYQNRVRTPVDAAKLSTSPVKEEKFVTLNKMAAKEPEMQKLDKEFQLLSTSLEKDFPALNASPTERASRHPVSPRQSDVEVFNKFVKISQKQRKRMESQSVGEDVKTAKKEEKIVKSPWAVINNESELLDDIMRQESTSFNGNLASSPPWQGNSKPGSSLSAVMANERRQREFLARMKSKPLIYTQMEDKAIEDLLVRYNANIVTDERISVRRAEYEFMVAPVWVSNRK